MIVNAAYFIENELPVFECYPNRRPKEKGWREVEYWSIDPEDALQWGCYAIAIEPNWLVVDVDLRKPEAHVSFAKLSEFVDFSQAFKCATARGGYHYWFKNPTEQPIRKNLNDYPGIDFLSTGCYVIGPGSIADTGTYVYSSGDLSSSPEADEKLLEALIRINPSKRDVFTVTVETSIELSRYKQWLEVQPSAISGENGNDYTYGLAAYGQDFGLSRSEILEAMQEWNERCSPPWDIDELAIIVDHATKYSQNAKGKAAIHFEAFTAKQPAIANEGLAVTVPRIETGVYDEAFYDTLHPGVGLTYRGDHILPTATNIRLVLLSDRYKGIFTWDVLRQKIVLERVPPWRGNKADVSLEMCDIDWRELRVDLSMQCRLECPSYLLEDGVYSLARAKSHHPIRDWLNKLQWDGTPRLAKIFGDDDYKMDVIKTFLLASICRIFYPGYKFDHILVLSGPQGIGKSYLVEILGGQFAKAMQHAPIDRKGLQELQGAWWLELPELSAIKRADINQIKAFITTTTDTYIPMYGKSGPQDFPRMFVPVWTLNPTEMGFLQDDQNRRFLIIEQKERIGLEFVKENRDQIFAEAMDAYRNDLTPHALVETLAAKAEEIADANKQDNSDIWEELIQNWIVSSGKTKIFNQDVYNGALDMYRKGEWDKNTQMRIATCLKRLGYVRKKSNNTAFFVKEDEDDIDLFNIESDNEV